MFAPVVAFGRHPAGGKAQTPSWTTKTRRHQVHDLCGVSGLWPNLCRAAGPTL